MHGKKVINNSVISVIYKLIILIIGFLTRKIFIEYIGEELLGLNSLYANLLDFLNMADLGISVAVQYQLYEPLVKKDYDKLSRIMSAAKKIYNIIGFFIIIVGFVLSFFVHFLIKETTYPIWYIRVSFVISIIGVASSYFFVHKKIFFYANEEFSLVNIIDLCCKIGTVTISLLATIIFKNYFLYLVINLFYGISSNVVVNIIYNKRYSGIIKKASEGKNEIKEITSNLKNVVPIKLSNYVYNSTDNVIISKVLGLATVAKYSNYMVIINAIMGIEYLFGNVITSTIGKIIKEGRETKETYGIYLVFQYVQYIFTSICFCCITIAFNSIIKLWIGTQFLLSNSFLIVLVLEFFVHSMCQPAYVMYGASGSFKKDKYVTIWSAVMNILISIVLVQFIGLIGVVIGTLITDIYIWVIRSYQVVRQYFHEQIGMYALKMVKYCVLTAISIIICVVLCHIINIENMLIGLVVEVIVSVLVSVIINLLFTWNSDEFNKCKEILIRYLRRS